MTVSCSQIEHFKGCNVRNEYHVVSDAVKRVDPTDNLTGPATGGHYRILVHLVNAAGELMA